MSDWGDWVGKSERHVDQSGESLLGRWVATIEPRSNMLGGVMPLGSHWCMCLPDTKTSELGQDGHPSKGYFLPPIPLPRRMWAASKVDFLSDIPVGAGIERVSTIASVQSKSGKSGDLVFVDVDHLTSADGVACVNERQSIVYLAPGEGILPLPDDDDVAHTEWPLTEQRRPDEATLFRFSALTFNSHRIHYDRPYAFDQEGYPALVVHGPLTATLLLDLASHELGQCNIGIFSFRGLEPAYCGQNLTLAAQKSDAGLLLAAFGGDGRKVMDAHVIAN